MGASPPKCRYATVTVNHHTVQVIGDHAPELAERFRRLEQARADRQQRRARLANTYPEGYRSSLDISADAAPRWIPRWMQRINAWYVCLGLTGLAWLLAWLLVWLFVVFALPFFSGAYSAWRAAAGH